MNGSGPPPGWEYLETVVNGQRCLTVVEECPSWATPELRKAWAIRREANATGRCACGAEFETLEPYQNRHERRAAAASARRTGQRAQPDFTEVTMDHGADCPAGDNSIRQLVQASRAAAN